MTEHPYGWLSLLPPVAAIVLAIATRRILMSLVGGIFLGALVTNAGEPIGALTDTLHIHIWETLVSNDKLQIAAFTLLMGAMVGVMGASGAMLGLVQAVSSLANTRRRVQTTTWGLGLLIFFDDYANTVLLGNTLRPLADRWRVSREKLAYIVDSTAAPVAGLALISTWIGVELDYVRQGLEGIDAAADWNAFQLFISSIPYRFYVLFALILVLVVALSGRDFGPMLRAERARLSGEVDPPDDLGSQAVPLPEQPAGRWQDAVIPVLVTVGVTLALMVATGLSQLGEEESITLMEIFGGANSYVSLLYGSLAGLIAAILLVRWQGVLNGQQVEMAAAQGAQLMVPALAILWLASGLSNLTGGNVVPPPDPALQTVEATLEHDSYPDRDTRLYTRSYLKSILEAQTTRSSEEWMLLALPSVIFLLSAFVAFSTGTSWATMGLLIPTVIPLSYDLVASATGTPPTPENPILLSSLGSVLAGAIFGDHCSPISDTTVLSSQSAGCGHINHVLTQLPYALLAGFLAIACGTLPVAFGAPASLLLVLGVALLIAAIWIFGRPVEDTSES